MNDVSLERYEGEQPVTLGPGGRLRAVRETKGMSRDEVAAKLHLGEDMVRSLENDEYSGLPDPVFIKGYLRKYARLLDEPEGPLLAAYTQAAPAGQRQTRLAVSGVKQEIRSSHFLVRAISWLILIGSLALLGLWLKDYFQEVMPSLTSTEAPVTETVDPVFTPEPEVVDEPAPLVLEAEAPSDEMAMEQSVSAPEFSLLTAEAGDSVEDKNTVTEPQAQMLAAAVDEQAENTEQALTVQQPPQTAAVADQPASTEEAQVQPESVAEQPLAPAEPLVVMEFEADSWVDLRDSSGGYRILGNLSKGERRVLEGTPPYSVVLGNSQAVKIRVRGEAFDVGPYTRGNVARFRLDPDQP